MRGAPSLFARVADVMAVLLAGLSLDDYCSINTSLKTLTKCLTAMGSRKKAATPPLRDSMLTHLLALCLGVRTGRASS